MARFGETEHGSAEPRGVLPSASEGSGAPDVLRQPRLTAGRPAAGSAGSDLPPQYPPPQYPGGGDRSWPPPPPQYPPPQYPGGGDRGWPAPQDPPPQYPGGGDRGWPPPPPQYPPPQYPGGGDRGWPAPQYPPPQYPGGGDRGWPPPQYPPPQYPPPEPASSVSPTGGGGRFFDRPGAPPATRGAAGFWLVMGLVGFAIGQVAGAVFVAIAAAIAGESGQLSRFATMAAPPEWYVGTSLVGLWTGFFLGPFVASKVRGTGRFLRDLGVRFRLVDLAGIPIGLGGQVLLDALYAPFLPHLKHFTAPTQKLVGAAHGWGFLVIAILTVCGAPFFEEILFRGLAFRALARFFAPAEPGPTIRRAIAIAAAVVVDGVLFGLAHWELYQFAGLAVFGMLLAIISYKTGRLGMNMVAHASFNFLAVLVVFATSGGVLR
jgi:membrane protease YdiL (CAAX protease family)